jgi:hypothetical protein
MKWIKHLEDSLKVSVSSKSSWRERERKTEKKRRKCERLGIKSIFLLALCFVALSCDALCCLALSCVV